MTRNRRGRRPDRLAIATVVNSLLLLALWMVERFIGEAQWFALLLTYVPQVFYGLLSILLIGVSLIARRRMILAVNVLAAVFVVFALMDFRIHPSRKPQSYQSPRDLIVMTYNVNKWGTGAARIASVVRAQHPDIVCLQEAGDYFYVPGHQPSALRHLLPEYRFAGQGELLVGSRLPVLRTWAAPLPPGPESRPALALLVSKEGHHVAVVCVHLLPTQLDTKRGESPLKFAADCQEFGAARIAQSRELLAFTQSIPPSYLMICGDFNAQPQARACRMLTDFGYSDAFDDTGNGFGYTVTSDVPLTRLDHILCGDGAEVQYAWVPDTRASDHRPLVAKITLAI